jgi:hypothetical protein
MDLLEMAISAAITGLTVFMSGYVMFKIGKNSIKNEIFDFLSSEEGAKLFYSIGVVVAQGAKQGFGITTKGGKFKFQDMLGQAVGGFLNNILGKAFGGQEQPQQQEQAESKEIEWRAPNGSPLDRKR